MEFKGQTDRGTILTIPSELVKKCVLLTREELITSNCSLTSKSLISIFYMSMHFIQCLSIRTDFLAIYDMILRYFDLEKNALKMPGNVFSPFILSDKV